MNGKLNEATIDALLDALSTDDDFRGRFAKAPRDATEGLGTNDPGVAALPNEPIRNLATKEAFRGARAHLRRKLMEAKSPFVPISLDVTAAR